MYQVSGLYHYRTLIVLHSQLTQEVPGYEQMRQVNIDDDDDKNWSPVITSWWQNMKPQVLDERCDFGHASMNIKNINIAE